MTLSQLAEADATAGHVYELVTRIAKELGPFVPRFGERYTVLGDNEDKVPINVKLIQIRDLPTTFPSLVCVTEHGVLVTLRKVGGFGNVSIYDYIALGEAPSWFNVLTIGVVLYALMLAHKDVCEKLQHAASEQLIRVKYYSDLEREIP